MKRTLALVLAMIMLLCMIPASMLTAFARGRGVYANTVPNQTIENADGQFIPETVVVDGDLGDTAWKEDDWKRVNTETGVWDVQYPDNSNKSFSYKYNVKKDYYYLYGAFVVPTNEAGLVKLWLNNVANEANRYTHVFTFDISNSSWTRETSTGAKVTDKSSYYYEKSKISFVQDGENTNIEFKVLLADFCAAPNPSIDYFVSVEAAKNQSLWHPMIEIDETFDRNSYFPSNDASTWKSEFAGEITTEDINGIGNNSIPSTIDLNGEFDEATWAHLTDFYSRWYERTNVVDYKNNANFMKPYADLSLNKTEWNATYQSAAEHDVRVSKNYIYGAALALNGVDTDTIVRFNMFDILEGGAYYQAVVYIQFSSSGVSYDATWYFGGSDSGQGSWDITEYVKAGAIVVNSDSGLYSFEFSLDRSFGSGFVPDVYDFCIAAGDNGREWSCANGYDGTGTSGYEQHPPYQASGRKQDYFPVLHFDNHDGLDLIEGGDRSNVEFYEPYTLYTIDGYLGYKAWPGLTFSAGGPANASYVTPELSDRLNGIQYLNSLRADYEFVYGALLVQADADSNFKEWKHGTKDHPAGGDLFSIWVSNPEATAGAYILRYDIWTYVEDGEVKARIGGYSGRTDSYYHFRDDMSVAFVNRENDPDSDRYYAFEYRIPLDSVNSKLDISIDTTEQAQENDSTPIFQYYTSFSIADSSNIIGGAAEDYKYAGIVWPKNNSSYTHTDGNVYGLYPDGWATPLTKTDVGGWTAAFTWAENPMYLRYQDVLRTVEPDGRIVEELRFDLDNVTFFNSEYRDSSKYGNSFTAKEEFYVGRDYAYLGAEIDGTLSSYNTKVILWLKTKDGSIHSYEFGHNGSSATMLYDGNAVTGSTYVDQFGMTSADGKTYFEAILDMDRFGGSQGFEYYIEIQQRVNGENLNRVFSDGTKKILLPEIDVASQLNSVKAWYQTAGKVEDLVHFPREEIKVDGNLNDNGWDPNEWSYVTTDVNANLQEADTHKDAFKTDFYYQLRVDEEYLYVAAVIFYSDCTLTANTTNIQASEPGFRIWLKSGLAGNNPLTDSNTYTDYYGINMKKDGTFLYGSKKNLMPTYANNTRQLYNKYYVPVVPAKNADGSYKYDENGKIAYTYDPTGMDTAYARFDGDTKYPSEFFGRTEYVVNEQEANKNAGVDEVLKGETINPENYEEEGMLDYSKTQYGVEHAIMRFGNASGYVNTFNHGRTEQLGSDSMVVEFKVKLDEFGGKDDFQYMVTTSSNNSWGGTRTTMYPAITSEVDSRDSYFHYYYPYWHWEDGSSATFDDVARADATLLTYKRPVITLGAKVSKTYMYQGKQTNALRMGGLWDSDYIRETKELLATNGYWPDKSGNPNWVDYWDVKAMGMVVIPTHLLKQNKTINENRPGIYDLFKGTTNSLWVDADGIVGWAGNDETRYPNNNYADYKNFAFYVTVVNIPTNVNFCFRGFVDYYDEVLDKAPSYYDIILERSIDMVIDSAIRTESEESDEEDNALPGGGFSRDESDGFTGTDGSDYENSTDGSEDVSEDVSDDVVTPGITTEKDGASLDIAWPSGFNANASGKYTNSLVFADNSGYGYKVGNFYATTDSDGNTTVFPGTELAYWTKLFLQQNSDGTFTLMNIEGSGGTTYADWVVADDVLVVAYHSDHPNASVFDSFKIGETFAIVGTTTFEEIAAVTASNTELSATLNRVIVCNHTSGWNAATCTTPETCKNCGAAKEGSYPLGHKYDANDEQTCMTGINCTVCGFEKVPALGHTNGLGKWTSDETAHWWTCTRETCDGTPGEKLNYAAHTYKNGKCSVCGYACTHPAEKLTFYPAVEPTCGVAGNVAYYEGSCGLKFEDANCTTPIDNVILPALEHDYGEDGVCKHCGDELTATIVGQLEHTYPGGYVSDGTADGYYTQVYADSGSAPHSMRGYATTTGQYTASTEHFPMPNDAGGGDLAWWRKISFRKISEVDGKEYFVAQAICEPAKVVDGVTVYDMSYLEDLSALTAEEKANHPWYVDSDVMVVAVGLHDTYINEFSALQLGDVVYISGEGAYTFTQIGDNTTPDKLLQDANGNFNTFLTLHRHKWSAATCETPRMCKECGEVDTSNEAYGHTPGAEATCDTAQTCETCKAILVPALGHDFATYTYNNNATCLANGTESATCGRGCGATDTREVEDSRLGHSFTNYINNNNASCTMNGTETAKCDRCSATNTREIADSALGHSFTKYVFDNNATCNANGTETAICDNNCGMSDTREVANSKFDHSFTSYVYNNDATCDEDGTETARCDYYGCTETDTRTKAGTALGHELVDEWSYDSSFHWHECSRCEGHKGAQEEHNFVDGFCSVCEKAKFDPIELMLTYPTGTVNDYDVLVFAYSNGSDTTINHTLRGFAPDFATAETDLENYTLYALDWVIEDGVDITTAEETLWKIVAIDTTGKAYYSEVTEGSFNSANALTWNVGATASAEGSHRMVIAVRKTSESYEDAQTLKVGDEIKWYGEWTYYAAGSTEKSEEMTNTFVEPACVHSWNAATCTKPMTCKNCGKTEGNALGHTPGAEADCLNAQVCTVCGEVLVEALDHEWNDATCTEPQTCIRCDATAGIALGHRLSNTLSYDDLSHWYGCLRDGCDYKSEVELHNYSGYSDICDDCGYERAHEHRFGTKVEEISATCTAEGRHEYYVCLGCSNWYADVNGSVEYEGKANDEDLIIPALGHSFTDYVSNGDATCLENGTETAKCDRCDATNTREDDDSALGHSFTNYVSNNNATCQNNCTETAKCDRCDATDTREIADTTVDHKYTNYVYNNDATCTEDGTETANCDYGCQVTDTRTKENSALGHDPVSEWNSDATTHWHECSRGCADYKDSEAEHNFVDGVCTVCSRTQFNPIKLDIAYPSSDVGNQTIVFAADSGNWGVYAFSTGNGNYPDTATLNGWHLIMLERVDGQTTGDGQWKVVRIDPNGTEYSDDNYKAEWRVGILSTGAIRMAIAVPPAKVTADNSVTMLEVNDLVNWVTPDGGTNYDAVAGSGTDYAVNAYLELDCIHSWNAATCEEPKTCKLCGKTDGTALGHSFTNYNANNDATCTANGTETATCDRCSVTNTREIADSALGHSFTNYVSNDNATCTANCTETATCEHGCGETDTREIADSALGHSFTNYVSDGNATCTADGTKTAKCDRCDATDTVADTGSALGHSFTNYVSDGNATCLADGTKTAKCDRCDATDTVADTGSALGHDWNAATCDTPKTCDRCDVTEGTALGHSFTNYVSDGNATCLADGTKTAKCDRCDVTDTVADFGSALGHEWIDATCTAPKTCDRCDITEGDPVDHIFNDYVSNNDASCEQDGTKTAACIYGCGETDTVVDYGTALEHRYENYEFITNPTCTDTGLKTATCSNGCGTTETVVVDALGHTEGPDATCTTDKICTVCGHVFEEAFGHNFVNQGDNTEKCQTCGEVRVLFTPVSIPLTHAGNDSYNSDYSWGVFVLAGSSYTAVSISSPDWCQAALLEYDDVLGMFRVVEKSAPTNGAATTYKSWYYGSDRIIIYANGGNADNAAKIANLKVDDYLELSGITFDTLKSRGDSSYAYMSESINLTTVDYHGVGDATAPQVLTPIIKEPKYNNFTVAYIPLDDRPVHTDRVVLTAEAAGINLLMPEDATMYQTHLYNASLGEEGHGGDPVRLLAWLKEQEANGVDYYVIALDQIFSGGLVNSRYSDASFNGQFTEQDKEIADFLVDLAKNNYVVYTDTIMRLASTYPYKDHTEVLYTMLRDYGKGENYYGTSNRIVLDENGTDKYNLTFEHVVSSYKFSKDATTPIGRYYQVGGSYYNLEDNILNGYLGARERKLRITDYMLRNAGGNINHYYIGMDDSAEGETIQKNEQRYIDMIIEQTGSNAITFAGADEMSVMGISAMTNLLVNTSENEQIPAADGWEISKVPVNVVYFSEEAKNWQADEYDSGKLGPAIDLHLKGLDAYQVADEYKLDKRVLQLVVVARGTEQYSFSSDGSAAQTQIALSRQNAANAADYIDAQLENNRPVAIIDVSYWNASHLNFVVEAMRNRGIFNRDDFNEILGYSTWNTAGNAIGLGMGQAFARYNYIMNTDVVSRSSNLGFTKLLAYSFVKDSAYRTNSFIGWTMDTSSAKTYTCGTYSYTTAGFTGNEFLGYINNSTKMLLKGGVSGDYDYNHNVSVHTPIWPANWGPRSFECWFTVEATSDEPETGDKFAGGGVVLPDEDFE